MVAGVRLDQVEWIYLEVNILVVAGPFDRSGCAGLDRCHLRWTDVSKGHTTETAYLYAIVVPELEEAA